MTNQGFFTDDDFGTDGGSQNFIVDPCSICGLFRNCSNPKMEPHGNFEKEIMIIGDLPTIADDQQGKNFTGEIGNILRTEALSAGLNLEVDCLLTNVLRCSSPDNIFKEEKVQFCYDKLEVLIKEKQPKLIMCFGKEAVTRIFGNVSSQLMSKLKQINNVHGYIFPSLKYNCWVSIHYSPRYIEGRPNDYLDIFKKSIVDATKYINKSLPLTLLDRLNVKYIDNPEEIAKCLQYHSESNTWVSFDFETSGLMPYASNFRIYLMSITLEINGKTSVLDLRENYYNINVALSNFALSEAPKVCHKFEVNIIYSLFGHGIKNWENDIMISQHVLDERKNNKSLEFQTFEATGEEFKQTVNKNDFLSELEYNFDAAIEYSGADAIYPLIITMNHFSKLHNNKLDYGHRFLMYGNEALAEMEHNGVKIDLKYFNEFSKEVETKATESFRLIWENRYVKEYQKYYGELKVSSPQNMGVLLFEIIGLQPNSYTDKGTAQVNDETFKKYEDEPDEDISELIKNIQIVRSLSKLDGTYLESIKKYIDDRGFLHPTFNLWIPRTYRSSCNNPNLQNVPTRDEYMRNFRKLFIPEYDGFLNTDYKGAEVTVQAILAQDKNLLQQINDNFDPHRYWASKLYEVDEDQVTKKMRSTTKNGLVFPEFYGSYYETIANDLGLDVDHVKQVEDDFYGMYYGVRQWQENQYRNYYRNGYIEISTGFKRRAPLSRNQIVNTPIQGATFHCLLDTLIRLTLVEMKNRKMKSKCRLQVHDSILIDYVDEERDEIIEIVNHVAADKSHWDWVKGATLSVEWEEGPNWLDMKEIKC
jgi:DNA polymerase-1